MTGFVGAKLMLFLGEDLLVIRRDHSAGIPWPGFLDFPGGGREGDETPRECALRETWEEVGLTVPASAITWSGLRGKNWFFAARQPASRVQDITFGGEGLGWQLMGPGEYTARGDAIPHFREMLRRYLSERESGRVR